MALELYRPGVRSLAVRKPNHRARRRYRFGAHKKRLRDPGTRLWEGTLVFAKAIGRYAGTGAGHQRVLRSGMSAVFHWWCEAGTRGNAHDKRQVAMDVASETASHFGFDEAAIDSALEELVPQWSTERCRNGHPEGRSQAYFEPEVDRVLQTEPLHVPEYRFSGG